METKYQFKLKEPNSIAVTSIRFQFYKDGHRFVFGTGKGIIPELWNFETQRPQTKDKRKNLIRKYKNRFPTLSLDLQNIDARLENIITETKSFFALKEEQNITADLKELKDFLKLRFDTKNTAKRSLNGHKLFLQEILSKFVIGITTGEITVKGSGKRYTPESVKTYRNLLSQYMKYQDTRKTKFQITDLSKEVYDSFLNYFNSKLYSVNTTAKHLRHFKVVINHELTYIKDENYKLEKKGLEPILTAIDIAKIDSSLKHFTLKQMTTTQVALTENELKRLYNLDLSSIPHFELARDVFLCGCYTSLRFNRYSVIGPEHYKKRIGGDVIEIIQRKTNNKVTIPVRPELKAILKKYDFKLPKTYEQKVNKYIKEICKMAQINEVIEVIRSKGNNNNTITQKPKYELVKTHTARRTGATLMYQSGMTHKDVMAITGHKSITSFEKYLRVPKEEILLRMKKGKFFKGNLLKSS